MRFYCIDDDTQFLKIFKNLMIKYSFQKNIEITTYTTTIIPESIPLNIDAFFLDVEIGSKKIFDFIKKIRNINCLVPIIIISNYDMYVINSVKYNIFDFIRKRKINEEINSTLDRLIDYLDDVLPNIFIKYDDALIKIQIRDIIYVELLSHKTIIYCKKNHYLANNDYNHIFKDKSNFLIQINRSHCINPIYLFSVKTDSVVLYNKISLPLGKKYKKKIIDYYMRRNT